LGGLDNLYFKSFNRLPSTQLTAVLFCLDSNFSDIAISDFIETKKRATFAPSAFVLGCPHLWVNSA
jgi:hypothetical protein